MRKERRRGSVRLDRPAYQEHVSQSDLVEDVRISPSAVSDEFPVEGTDYAAVVRKLTERGGGRRIVLGNASERRETIDGIG